jgi:hypothetical protein
MDAFDALREADANRIEWIKAARVFTRFLDRITDKTTVAWLERVWEQEASNPLVPASAGWKLVAEARDEIVLEAPLSWDEAVAADLSLSDVMREAEAWRRARERRDNEVEKEVGQAIEQERKVG